MQGNHYTNSNPTKAKADWPPVVVAGAHQTGVNLMRTLARRGLRVVCSAHNRAQPGFHTVYGRAWECPAPQDGSVAWRDSMIALARKLGRKPVLIAGADIYVSAMAQHANELSAHYAFCQSSVATQALLATKERQYEMADANGMPVPRTRLAKSAEDVMAFAAESQFPCLLKPLQAGKWEHLPHDHPLFCTKVALADSGEELTASYRLCRDYTPEVVVQEIIQGPDTAKLVYLSCYGGNGNRIGNCIVRELRTQPIGFGSATVVEPFFDEEADELCDRFLRKLQYAGLCEIELKRDVRNGRLKMIEANPRYSGTGDAAQYAGVDVGWLHYLDLIGVEVKPISQSSRNFRHVVLFRDLVGLRSYRQAGLLSWRSLLHSYRPPLAFYDVHVRDWRVLARATFEFAGLVVGFLLRRVFGKRSAKS
jgi:predicted ATP-grasp superfamily ATP-dependent carboligase